MRVIEFGPRMTEYLLFEVNKDSIAPKKDISCNSPNRDSGLEGVGSMETKVAMHKELDAARKQVLICLNQFREQNDTFSLFFIHNHRLTFCLHGITIRKRMFLEEKNPPISS